MTAKIDGMSLREQSIFAGVLDAESVNGLDDALRLSERLDDYVILPNIISDIELGRFLVDTGYKDFPEAVLARRCCSLACRSSGIRSRRAGIATTCAERPGIPSGPLPWKTR